MVAHVALDGKMTQKKKVIYRLSLFSPGKEISLMGVFSMCSYLTFHRIRKTFVPPACFLPDVQLCMTSHESAAIAK